MNKITDTVKRKFGDEIVIAEISDTVKAFRWRLRIGKYSTEWTGYYEGVLTIRSQKTGAVYGYASAYWTSVIPIEQPFMITEGQHV